MVGALGIVFYNDLRICLYTQWEPYDLYQVLLAAAMDPISWVGIFAGYV